MAIKRYDVQPGRHSRIVSSNGFTFFTGHVAPKWETLSEQSEALCKRFDELFGMFSLQKKNLLYVMTYLENADEETDFTDAYFPWLDPVQKPAGLTVTARLNPYNTTGHILMEVHPILATEPDAKIEQYDTDPQKASRMVKCNGLAFFTGHVFPRGKTLLEQTRGVLNRYMELFAQFNLKKEKVVAANAYLKDASEAAEFFEGWNDFWGENPPALVVVQCPPNQKTAFGDNLKLELELIVADNDVEVKRYGVQEGKSDLVSAAGLGWFSAIGSGLPADAGMAAQVAALYPKYEAMFEKYGVKKENLLMHYIYIRNMDMMNVFEPAVKSAIAPNDPPCGLSVEGVPTCADDLLIVQFVASMNGE